MPILIRIAFALNTGSAVGDDYMGLLHNRAALVSDCAANRPIQHLSFENGDEQNALNDHNGKGNKSEQKQATCLIHDPSFKSKRNH